MVPLETSGLEARQGNKEWGAWQRALGMDHRGSDVTGGGGRALPLWSVRNVFCTLWYGGVSP